MPSNKSRRPGRQTERHRRQTRIAPVTPASPTPNAAPVQAAPGAVPVRRPLQSSPTAGVLRAEDVMQESRFVRADLVRMLLTMLAVILFMVAAHYLLQ